MYFNIIIPILLGMYAYFGKKITASGSILAILLSIIIYTYGSYIAFAALSVVFMLTTISDKMKKTKPDKIRNIKQIISNVLTASLCIVLYYFSNNEHIYYVMYYAVIASSLSDTLASSVGTFSKRKPFNILTLKNIETGESGGVTLLGLLASLLGGVIIGGIYLLSNYNITNFILISLMGLIGSVFDSILGSSCEAKYICTKCIQKTEDTCCGDIQLINGYAFFDNNLVNLLNNIFIFIISYLILS